MAFRAETPDNAGPQRGLVDQEEVACVVSDMQAAVGKKTGDHSGGSHVDDRIVVSNEHQGFGADEGAKRQSRVGSGRGC